jgi:alpha-mannosidase
VGPAEVKNGSLVTSFTAYQPRTFALKLDAPPTHVTAVHSEPVTLHYDLAGASTDGTPVSGGFDGKGNALPAEMLPQTLHFEGVDFHLAPAQNGTPDALVANGQTIDLPQGQHNRVYLLAAAVDGDQKADFRVGDHTTTLNIEDWGGFIGPWDDRQWQAGEVQMPARNGRPARTEHDDYAQMTGIRPGYIKRASLAWYCSHHHDASGKNVAYSYSYLFGYSIDVPAGARTITLPKNDKVRILAISVAQENPAIHPARPLYDTLGRSEPGPVEQP